MIKRKDIYYGNSKYLILNPDFSEQLLITLNQVEDLNRNLEFKINGEIITYNQKFSNTEPQSGTTFKIINNNLAIFSSDYNDLLNVNYYQKLMDLVRNNLTNFEHKWKYYVNDLVIQKSFNLDRFENLYLNLKLEQAIDKYSATEVQKINHFIDDLHQLLIKTDREAGKINWNIFKSDWFKKFGNDNKIKNMAITFTLKDFENPIVQVETYNHNCFNTTLKNSLKPDSDLIEYLKMYKINNKIKTNDKIITNKITKGI